jgi:hypothetical protein
MQLPLLSLFTTISVLFGANTAPTLDVAPKTVVLQGSKLLEARTKLVNNAAGAKLQAAFSRRQLYVNITKLIFLQNVWKGRQTTSLTRVLGP